MSAKILIVDDEPDLRLLVRLALRDPAFEVTEAATGEEALEAVAAETFDVVLLDLNLPGIGGMEVLAAWKAAGIIPSLPVLMLTADARPGLDHVAAAGGAGGFLTKPIGPSELVAAVRAALPRNGAPPASVGGS